MQERIRVVEVVALRGDPPVVVDAGTPVRSVVSSMREAGCGCALVTRDGRLVGIFTERDALMKVLGTEGALEAPVANVMTPDPAFVSDGDPIRKAVAKMQKGGFRNIPIVDAAGKIVGCVRHKDMIAYLVENFADRALNVPPDPDQQAKARDGA
jgi:CBS domain-containing protein